MNATDAIFGEGSTFKITHTRDEHLVSPGRRDRVL